MNTTTATATVGAPDAAAAHAATRESLSFKPGAEECGIDILRVQEMRGCEPPTRIVNALHCIKNVVNLRGVIVLGATLASAWAQAVPRVTETADALAPHECEAEANASRETSLDAADLNQPELVLGCGVGASTQLNVNVVRESAAGESAHGLGLLGKTTLVFPETGRTGWGLAYGMTAGKAASAGTWKLQELAVFAASTRELTPGWLGHANLGTRHDRSTRQNSLLWSVGLEGTANLSLAADVYGDDRSRPWASMGLGYSFGGGFSASLRVAQQFEQPRVHSVTLGAKLAF